MSYPHLKNAPIAEALLDIRVRPNPGFDTEDLHPLQGLLKGRFTKVSEQRPLSIEFRPGDSRQKREVGGLETLILRSEDDLTVGQFRASGLTLNRLAPYQSWSEMLPCALELWTNYCSIAQPMEIVRLAVRYINHIVCPDGMKSYDEVLTAIPRIPPGIPQYMSTFLTRVTTHDPEREVSAHVSQALEVTPEGRPSKLILDIDAYSEQVLPVDSEDVEGTLERLRDYKNDIFFGSLTPATIERYE